MSSLNDILRVINIILREETNILSFFYQLDILNNKDILQP
jgi:hypothetical protein